MDVSVLGVDLGKNSCSVVGLDATGKVVVRRRMRRETVITYAATLPVCVIAMKACCGAHHMGRALARQGHAVRLFLPRSTPRTDTSMIFAPSSNNLLS